MKRNEDNLSLIIKLINEANGKISPNHLSLSLEIYLTSMEQFNCGILHHTITPSSTIQFTSSMDGMGSQQFHRMIS